MRRRLLRGAARRALRGEPFDPGELDAVLDDAFERYDRERTDLPAEPNVGGRLMVRLAALTASFYAALVARGRAPDEARRLTSLVTAYVYRGMTAVPTAAAKLLRRGPARRVALGLDLMRVFPFGPPAYDMRDVQETGAVGLDVWRCPTADYFRARGLGELCVDSWCKLDYELARAWGAELHRSATLAAGAERCDFRFQVGESRT